MTMQMVSVINNRRRLIIGVLALLIVIIASILLAWQPWVDKEARRLEQIRRDLVTSSQERLAEKDRQVAETANRINVVREELNKPELTDEQKYALYYEGAIILASKKDDEAKTFAKQALTYFPSDPEFKARYKTIYNKLVAISKGDFNVVSQ